MMDFFDGFIKGYSSDKIKNELDAISRTIEDALSDVEVLKNIFSCIDLTTLNTTDSAEKVQAFVERINEFEQVRGDVPNVAAICVYPVFAPIIANYLKVPGVGKACVSAGFPSSQTFLDLKVIETKKAIDFGADEIDVVLSVGEFLEGNYEFVFEEIRKLKEEVVLDNKLKVILETGCMPEENDVWESSLLVMEAGADFIKTSTGKTSPAATPEAAFIMAHAIKAYYAKTGEKIGFKAAGGISDSLDAVFYYLIVKEILGEKWLNNKLFRIGASRLANNLLRDISAIDSDVKYGTFKF